MKKTRVVNICLDPYDVYIGRPGRNQTGIFGNPFPVGKVCKRCGELHTDRGSTLPCFEAYFHDRVAKDREFWLRVMRLRGKTLGCFCKPIHPCHGDIIANYVDNQS